MFVCARDRSSRAGPFRLGHEQQKYTDGQDGCKSERIQWWERERCVWKDYLLVSCFISKKSMLGLPF